MNLDQIDQMLINYCNQNKILFLPIEEIKNKINAIEVILLKKFEKYIDENNKNRKCLDLGLEEYEYSEELEMISEQNDKFIINYNNKYILEINNLTDLKKFTDKFFDYNYNGLSDKEFINLQWFFDRMCYIYNTTNTKAFDFRVPDNKWVFIYD